MISDVGRALRAVLRPHLPADAEVRLGRPSEADGSGTAGGPALHVALCWLRGDPNGRQSGEWDVRADDGTLIGRQSPARRYELRFLVTARADDPETELDLLDGALRAVTELDALPTETLSKELLEAGLPVFLQVCSEPSLADDGVPAYAGFELTVSAPLLPPLRTDLAPPAAELTVGMRRPMGPSRGAPGAGSNAAPAAGSAGSAGAARPAGGGPPANLPAPAGTPSANGAPPGRQWRRARVSEE